jgi:hypothetical protein
MKYSIQSLTFALAVLVMGCGSLHHANQATSAPAEHPVANREDLFEILRYVYLWHFDESLSFHVPDEDVIEIWIREVPVELDEGDESRFAEVWLPQINLSVNLKQANYAIPELGIAVRNESFKVQSVTYKDRGDAPRSDFQIMRYEEQEVIDHLFSTRNLKRFPDDALRANLRRAMIRHEFDALQQITGDQVVYVSPISPVSNNLWVFHENLKRLVRFSADMDLNNPAYWSTTPVHVEVYDLDAAVVVSPDEMPGTDAYLTKGFTGRALFNCLILGMRIEISEADALTAFQEIRDTLDP